MANITSNKTEQVVMRNRIDVDGVPVKHQEYTINSDNPENIGQSSYFANDDAKIVYKSNRVAIRAQEDAFEDEVFAKADSMINAKEGAK